MSHTRERGDGRIFCFLFVFQDHELLRRNNTREQKHKNSIVRLFLRLFSMFQLKVLDGGTNGRLILAIDDLWRGLRRKLWSGLWNLNMNIMDKINMNRIKSICCLLASSK